MNKTVMTIMENKLNSAKESRNDVVNTEHRILQNSCGRDRRKISKVYDIRERLEWLTRLMNSYPYFTSIASRCCTIQILAIREGQF